VDKEKHFTIHEKLIELKRVFHKKQRINKVKKWPKIVQKMRMLETKNNKRDKLRNHNFLSTSSGYVDSVTCPIDVNYLVSPHAETTMPNNPHLQSLPDAALSSSQGVCVRLCVCACVHACVRTWGCACVRACVFYVN